jgi:hypothetical protein
MIDDVAAFLILAPVVSTLAILVVVAAWLLGGRGLGPRPVVNSLTRVEEEVAAHRKT